MGSYSELYIGDHLYSWKYFVPDFVALLFDESDYVSTPAEDADLAEDDEEGYFDHGFLTTCGKARERLINVGITLELLSRIHFHYFAFDFDAYREDLHERAAEYLTAKYGSEREEHKIERFVRLLIRRFRRLSKDEEFDVVLLAAKRSGSRKAYKVQMEKQLQQADWQDPQGQARNFDWLSFHRKYLRELLAKDPYVEYGKEDFEFDDIGSLDLWLLYSLGLSIFGSKENVPVELDFGEIVEGRPPLNRGEVVSWINQMRSNLRLRAEEMEMAFGGVGKAAQTNFTSQALEKLGGRTAKEKGDALEALVSSLFSSEEGFEIKGSRRRSDEEIDLVVMNRLPDPFWQSLRSPTLIVECRNRRKKVQAKEIRDFEIKLQNSVALCRLGVLISTSGFTREAELAAKRASRETYKMILVDRSILVTRLRTNQSTKLWLEEILMEQF